MCASVLQIAVSQAILALQPILACQEVVRRALLLNGLRNRLSHHQPEMRDVRDYPVDVIAALKAAKIERINTSSTVQCNDVRLAKWAAEVVRAFVDEWWRIGRVPSAIDRAHWESGPDWAYPTNEAIAHTT